MKKIIFCLLIIASFANAKTINVLDWTPEFKYSSVERYTHEEAKEYCMNKKNCHLACDRPSKCTINKTILNCPAFKTNTMDEYIATPAHMHKVINHCFADGKVRLFYEGEHTLNYSFERNNVEYVVTKFDKYDNKFGYIFRIRKRLMTNKDIKFKQN